jgi:hypothetical protein
VIDRFSLRIFLAPWRKAVNSAAEDNPPAVHIDSMETGILLSKAEITSHVLSVLAFSMKTILATILELWLLIVSINFGMFSSSLRQGITIPNFQLAT